MYVDLIFSIYEFYVDSKKRIQNVISEIQYDVSLNKMRWEITKKPDHHSHRLTLDWTL